MIKGHTQTGIDSIVKSATSIKEIGHDLYLSHAERSEKQFDSVYGFFNHMTLGTLDGLSSAYEGAKERTAKRNESWFDFGNYLTIGILGTMKGAVSPSDPFSKEHWQSIFEVGAVVAPALKVTKIPGSHVPNPRNPPEFEGTGEAFNIAKLKQVFISGNVEEIRRIIKESSFGHLEPKDINNLFERIKTNTAIENGINRVSLQRELVKKALDSGVKTELLVAADNRFLNEKGWIKWPDNDGFISELTVGNRPTRILGKGKVIDRYGGISGNYVSPKYPEVSYEQRALPYMYNPNAYHKYEIIKPIPNVQHGEIAFAFEQSGGGIQYILPESIEYYLKEGYIREILN